MTRPATKNAPAPARVVQLGDHVLYDQVHEALVARVHLVGDRDSPVDLTYVDANVLRVAKQVPHAAGPLGWRFSEEADAERIRTPLELVDLARSRGERVPSVGDWVTYGYDVGKNGFVEVVPTRALIVDVHSLTIIDIDVYKQKPPENLDEVDIPIHFGRRHGSTQAEFANENVKKLGYGGCWSYPDSDIIKPFEPTERWKIFPNFTCRCGTPCKFGIPVYIGEPSPPSVLIGSPEKSNKPVAMLCAGCVAHLRTHLEIFPGSRPPA